MARNIDFEFKYVVSEKNLADPVSCRDMVSSFTRLQTPVPLPDVLFHTLPMPSTPDLSASANVDVLSIMTILRTAYADSVLVSSLCMTNG